MLALYEEPQVKIFRNISKNYLCKTDTYVKISMSVALIFNLQYQQENYNWPVSTQ